METEELLDELCSYEFEKEWYKFKLNYENDDEIGDISPRYQILLPIAEENMLILSGA